MRVAFALQSFKSYFCSMEQTKSFQQILLELSAAFEERFLPHISLDCVIFGFHEASLKVLLLKMKGENTWSLPGGYVGKQEDLEEAANRILEERTGATNIYLQQFKVFSDPNRSQSFLKECLRLCGTNSDLFRLDFMH